MNIPFRLGLIGTGQITIQSHLPAALASKQVAVTALVDPVVERAQRLANAYGIHPKVAGSFDAISNDVDGVIVATPNHTHRDIAVACAKAHIHCLIEKPLTATVSEGEAIVVAAKEHAVVIAVGYTTRFRDDVVLFNHLFHSGYFGKPKQFVYQFGTVGGWAPLSAYNLSKTASGGGVLMVTGSHFIDRMLAWFGYPETVAFEDDSLGGPEANCVATVGYSHAGQPFMGTIRLSKTIAMPPGFVLETDKGLVVIPDKAPFLLNFRPFSEPDIALKVQPRQGSLFASRKSFFQLQLENFVQACQGKAPVMVDVEQGLASVRLMNALYACRTPMKEDF